MTGYTSKYTYHLQEEFPSIKQKTQPEEIAFQCIEAVFEIDGEDYTIQFDGYQKILGIWDSDGGKIERI